MSGAGTVRGHNKQLSDVIPPRSFDMQQTLVKEGEGGNVLEMKWGRGERNTVSERRGKREREMNLSRIFHENKVCAGSVSGTHCTAQKESIQSDN